MIIAIIQLGYCCHFFFQFKIDIISHHPHPTINSLHTAIQHVGNAMHQ